MADITVQLNGQATTLAADSTLLQLLDQTGLSQRRVAVEINQAIVPRSLHEQQVLRDGDRIEVVAAIGGG